MQIRIEARQAKQPLDDWLGTGDAKLVFLFGLTLVRPYKYRKAAAVHETKFGEIHDEELRATIQGTADGRTQPLLGGRVKFALQPHYRSSSTVVNGDGQVGGDRHQVPFREVATAAPRIAASPGRRAS